MFYKNILFTVPQILFNFSNAYSGQTFFDDWFITMFNVFFTTMPLAIRAIFDKDVYYKEWYDSTYSQESMLKFMPLVKTYYPYLYTKEGKRLHLITIGKLMIEVAKGGITGILVYFLIQQCMNRPISVNGHMADVWSVSLVTYSCIILIVNLRLCFLTRVYNLFTVLTYFAFTITAYVVFLILVDSSVLFQGYKTAGTGLLNWKFFQILLLCLVLIFVVELLFALLNKEIWTTLSTYYISIIKKGRETESKLFENLIMQIKRKSKLKQIL